MKLTKPVIVMEERKENMLEKVTLEQKPEQQSPSSLNSPAAEPEKDSSQDYNIFKHKMKTIKDIEIIENFVIIENLVDLGLFEPF